MTSTPLTDTASFRIVGHRGAASFEPENTAPSFRYALDAGVDAVELDVTLTGDERVLVHHDLDTRRMCGRGGAIRERALDELRKMTVRAKRSGKGRGRGPRLLSLDEALAILRPDVPVFVELKGVADHGPGLAAEVAAALDRTGGLANAWVLSSVPELLVAVRDVDARIARALVVRARPAYDVDRVLDELECELVVPNRRHVDRAFVTRMRKKSSALFPYTVNTRREAERLRRAGANGIITDVPSRALAWFGRSEPAARHAERAELLAIDLGSSRIEVAAMSASGRLLTTERAPCPTVEGERGEIGVDARRLAQTVDRLATRVLDRHPSIRKLGIASQRSTFVMWDRSTGRPIGDAPSWRCQRGRRLVAARSGSADLVRRLTGLRLSAAYSASKISWKLRRLDRTRSGHVPDVLVAPLSGYLLWRWSGGALHRTDPTLAGRTLLFDSQRQCWDDRLLELFGVPRSILPEPRATFGDLGRVRIGGRELALAVEAGDQQAALAGLRIDNPGHLHINLGTGGFVLAHTGEVRRRVRGLLTGVAWQGTGGTAPHYLLEGAVLGLGASLDRHAAKHAIDRLGLAELVARGAGGDTRVLPAHEGLGSPYWDARRRFVVRGRRDPASVAHGIMEGLAHLVRENVELLGNALPKDDDSIGIAGGPAHDAHFVQILADVLGRSLRVSATRDATLLGTAALSSGLVRTRSHPSPAPLATVHPRRDTGVARRRHVEWRRAVGLRVADRRP